MVQRVFIKVVGFSDDERHALNTVFRLSEQCQTMYQLWTREAAEPARMAILDGHSYEARLEAEMADTETTRLMWVGEDAPPQVWRTFQRPLAWTEMVQAMDLVFVRDSEDVDFDLGLGDGGEVPAPEVMSNKRALIVSPERDDRLYWRARLALSRLTHADEAESGLQALELVRGTRYDLAVINFGLLDMTAWTLLKQLKEGKRGITRVAVATTHGTLPEHVRAWMAGAEALLDTPPHPQRFEELLRRV